MYIFDTKPALQEKKVQIVQNLFTSQTCLTGNGNTNRITQCKHMLQCTFHISCFTQHIVIVRVICPLTMKNISTLGIYFCMTMRDDGKIYLSCLSWYCLVVTCGWIYSSSLE